MVGNNHYTADSGYETLSQTHNDLRLLKQLFTRCCQINEKHILLYRDLGLDEFKRHLDAFIQLLAPGDRVIIFFSGHGEADGSLVFTDGGRLSPLKMINFSDQKTGLMLMLTLDYNFNFKEKGILGLGLSGGWYTNSYEKNDHSVI